MTNPASGPKPGAFIFTAQEGAKWIER